MSAGPRVLSVGTAIPTYQIGQSTVEKYAREHFAGTLNGRLEAALRVVRRTGVERRRFVVPAGWFSSPHTWAQREALYEIHAPCLAHEAARRALERAGAAPEDIGAVVWVSSTGDPLPSPASGLVESLGLGGGTKRRPLVGLGCAGGAAGLDLATDIVRPGKPVLLVAAECCGLSHQIEDTSDPDRAMVALVSLALFADGAAAAVLGYEGEGPEVVAGHSTTWPGTSEMMGWKTREPGFAVVLSDRVPGFVRQEARSSAEGACRAAGIGLEDVTHPVVHPGSSRVLDAFGEALELPDDALDMSREVLRDHGNMSSVTVLFVLEQLLNGDRWGAGEYGLLSAMGPGFAAEHVVLRS